jgi:hypothetical protein
VTANRVPLRTSGASWGGPDMKVCESATAVGRDAYKAMVAEPGPALSGVS